MLFAFARSLTPPDHLAAGSVEADCEQRLALNPGNKDVIGREDRRGMSSGQRRPPDSILLPVELLGKTFRGRDAGAVRPSELRPIGRCKCNLNQQPAKPTHSNECTLSAA